MALPKDKKGAGTTSKGSTKGATKQVEERTAEIINSWSMKEFAAEYGIIKASPVRLNEKGFPFITFLQEEKDETTGKNIAENIYFSKAAALEVTEGDDPTIIKSLGLKVLELEYSDGETRLKLSKEGDGGEYVSITDLF